MPNIVYVDTAKSAVTVTTPTITNDGITTTELVIQVVNTDGNLMPNIPTSAFVLTGIVGVTATPVDTKTDEDGEHRWTIISSTAGNYTIGASVLGVVISDTAALVVDATYVPPAPSWEVVRNFNAGPVGTGVTAKPDGMGTTSAVYDNTYFVEGGMSAKNTIEFGKTAFGTWGGVIGFPPLYRYDELWVQVWFYFPVGFMIQTDTKSDGKTTGMSSSLKTLRIRSKKADGSHTGYLEFQVQNDSRQTPTGTQYRTFKEGNQTSPFYRNFGAPNSLTRGEWHRFVWYIKFDNATSRNGGQARHKIWQNNVLLIDDTTLPTMNAATDVQTALYIWTHYNSGSPKTQSAWVDDVRIASGQPAWASNLEGV